MLEASPSSVLSFVSFSCARGERAFKNTAIFPAPCLWLHQHIDLVPNRPSSKMLLLGPAEMPAKLRTTTFTNGKQNSWQQTERTHVYPVQNHTRLLHHGLLQTPLCTACISYEIKGNVPLWNNCKVPVRAMSSFLLRYSRCNKISQPVSRTWGIYSGRQNVLCDPKISLYRNYWNAECAELGSWAGTN